MTMLHQFMTCASWSRFANPVKQWSDILVKAELDLDTYVHVENPLLQSPTEKRRGWDG